jgi:hypothetical protein
MRTSTGRRAFPARVVPVLKPLYQRSVDTSRPGGTPPEHQQQKGEVMPGLTTLADWITFINHPDATIRDEMGRDVSTHEMQERMTATTDRHGRPLRPRFRHSNPASAVRCGPAIRLPGRSGGCGSPAPRRAVAGRGCARCGEEAHPITLTTPPHRATRSG